MIVVATNNGNQFLPKFLETYEQFKSSDYELLIVDTGSTDENFKAYLGNLKSKYQVTQTPYKGYDTGAYIWAYRNFPSNEYMFLQDSIEFKEFHWLEKFRAKCTDNVGIVPWAVFDGNYDNQDQVQFIHKNIGITNTKGWGVFGPIFYTTKESMDLLEENKLLDIIPTIKNEQMAMERGWSAMFNAINKDYAFINLYNHPAMLENRLSLFYKKLPRRD